MTLPRHPLLRALLALWGLLFLMGALFVGVLLGGALLLWNALRGGRSVMRFADIGPRVRRAAPVRTGDVVIEGQATRVD